MRKHCGMWHGTFKIKNKNIYFSASKHKEKMKLTDHRIPVTCPSHICRVRVEPESHHKPFESESSHDLVDSSQIRVTRTVESLRVIALEARVNVESNEIAYFFLFLFFCYEMATNML